MAKSGNTWFKIKRTKGRKVGFLHSKVDVPAMRTLDHMEIAKNGFVNRKAVKPRAEGKCKYVGRQLTLTEQCKAREARRDDYYRQLGFPC
jgi:hypothetical protein